MLSEQRPLPVSSGGRAVQVRSRPMGGLLHPRNTADRRVLNLLHPGTSPPHPPHPSGGPSQGPLCCTPVEVVASTRMRVSGLVQADLCSGGTQVQVRLKIKSPSERAFACMPYFILRL